MNDEPAAFVFGLLMGALMLLVFLSVLGLFEYVSPQVLVEKNVLEYRMTDAKSGKVELFWTATGEKL